MAEEQIRNEIENRLREASLLSFLDMARTQFLDLPDRTYVEIVLNAAEKEPDVRASLSGFEPPIDLQIRPVWKIEDIGEPEIAVSPSGGIIAARMLAVTLRSGLVTTVVQVAVTWLAEEELKRVLGTQPDLKALVREYVENWLQWGGESYWDPRRYSRLEIGADRALSLYRALQKTA